MYLFFSHQDPSKSKAGKGKGKADASKAEDDLASLLKDMATKMTERANSGHPPWSQSAQDMIDALDQLENLYKDKSAVLREVLLAGLRSFEPGTQYQYQDHDGEGRLAGNSPTSTSSPLLKLPFEGANRIEIYHSHLLTLEDYCACSRYEAICYSH